MQLEDQLFCVKSYARSNEACKEQTGFNTNYNMAI